MINFTGDLIDDCKLLETEIKKINLHPATNRRHINNGKAPRSCVYGYVPWSKYSNGKPRIESQEYPGWFHSKLKTNYPFLDQIFKDFAAHHLPKDFKFTQVVVNKNFKTMKHKDAANVGRSFIVGLGDYIDGDLVVVRDDKEENIDIKYRPYGFDGSAIEHFTREFTGNRYSVVWFHNSKLDNQKK